MGLPSPLTDDSALTLLDPSVLDGLAQIMAPDDLRDLLADMLGDVQERLKRIPQTKALRQVQQDAHDIKSMSGNFGMTDLSACAAGVERAARRGAADSVADALPALAEIGRLSIAAMTERYAIKPGESG